MVGWTDLPKSAQPAEETKKGATPLPVGASQDVTNRINLYGTVRAVLLLLTILVHDDSFVKGDMEAHAEVQRILPKLGLPLRALMNLMSILDIATSSQLEPFMGWLWHGDSSSSLKFRGNPFSTLVDIYLHSHCGSGLGDWLLVTD